MIQRCMAVPLPLLLLFVLAAACSDDDIQLGSDGGNVDTGSVDAPRPDAAMPDAFIPSFDPTVCGIKKYAWLPPGSMGKVVEKKKSPLFSLSKAALETMLLLTEFKDVAKVKYGAKVYFYRYETQDRGKKVQATGAMAFPDLPDGQTLSAPMVLWLHGTTGFSDKCAPTYKVSDAAAPAALMAALGYIGIAPDLLGMNGFGAASTMPHPYVVSEPTAIAALDAMRAAASIVKAETSEVTATNELVVWGPSQGGHATLSTVLYQPHYAPEVKVVAALPLIAPADLKLQAKAALTTLSDSTVILAGIFAAQARWYGHEARLNEVFTGTWTKQLPQLMDTVCSVDKKKYNLTKMTELFTPAYINAAVKNDYSSMSTWGCMLGENSMTSTSVKMKEYPPMYFVMGEQDELVDTASQRQSFDALCKAGYKMNFLECKGANHVSGGLWSLPEQFAWLEDRLAGKAMTNACKREAAACCKGTPAGKCK